MNIGLLNTRILIQKNAVVTDAIGNHTNSWTDYYSCAATVGNESGSEVDKASQTVESDICAFTVRWCQAVSEITSSGYRILWNDEIFNISFIDHMNNKRKSIKLWAKKVRR